MTSGIVAQSSGFQTKIKVQKETAEQTRQFSDMVSNDVRSAGKNLTVQTASGNCTYPSGIALFNCVGAPTTGCTAVFNTVPTNSPTDSATYSGNTLVFNAKNSGTWVYYSDASGQQVYYGAESGSNILSNQVFSTIKTASNKLFDDSKFAAILKFGGFSPSTADTQVNKQQSFVLFNIEVQTSNFSTLPPSQRADTTIRSMVTSRNYNN